ncbi:hypothetical protein HDF14_003327 [Edaphobacter lichenicola]|uniref:Uncharacterized protein n=1 Tax=Tunturiibacter gelidiferens TaxID=3069689 RepID=A0A9X0QG19_9BACT|nr:hypothetical protein [Edaphobacter lichenicola]MBB5329705.1 hypothetical protein [Edaphobacter lichenicola]
MKCKLFNSRWHRPVLSWIGWHKMQSTGLPVIPTVRQGMGFHLSMCIMPLLENGVMGNYDLDSAGTKVDVEKLGLG